jgi:nitrogen-specific signal transduction histidine kinase
MRRGDITKQMQDLFNLMCEGIILIHEDGRVSFINRAGCSILGIKFRKGSRQTITDCVPDINRAFIDLINENIGKARRLYRQEVMYVRNLRLQRLIVSMSPEKSVPGYGVCQVVTVENVTELWRLHYQERKLHYRLSKNYNTQIESLREIADSVAHEVRNPISSIGGYAELLMKKCVDAEFDRDEMNKYLRYIREDAEKLNRIVTAVERYADMSDISFKRENAVHLFNSVVSSARKHAAKSNIRIETMPQDMNEYYIYVDRKKIKSALRDFFWQAISMSNADSRIIVDSQFSPYEALMIVEFISDRIRKGDIHFAFNPFMLSFPGQETFNLSLAQRIMILHGGIITVNHENDNKVISRISFPREKRLARREDRDFT